MHRAAYREETRKRGRLGTWVRLLSAGCLLLFFQGNRLEGTRGDILRYTYIHASDVVASYRRRTFMHLVRAMGLSGST